MSKSFSIVLTLLKTKSSKSRGLCETVSLRSATTTTGKEAATSVGSDKKQPSSDCCIQQYLQRFDCCSSNPDLLVLYLSASSPASQIKFVVRDLFDRIRNFIIVPNLIL